MAAKNNLTMTSDVQVTAREIDFVTRFARNWQHLRDILGIMRPIKKQPGTVLKSKTASVTLAQSVGEGEEIPYSKATVVEKDYANINVEKYAALERVYRGLVGLTALTALLVSVLAGVAVAVATEAWVAPRTSPTPATASVGEEHR